MNEPRMTWQQGLDYSREHGLLAMQLYMVQSTPTDGLGPVLAVLDTHIAYQRQLEADGVMFAAGPLADEAEQDWLGEGIFVYRAASRDEAVKLAEGDPMHQSGARRFTVRLWMLNEGSFSVRLLFSNGRPEIS